ncbi:ABC transporter ATP-binding protein [Salinibacter grassmerensis]|uniref:ABC transporter ATP-binding protein n=1 Tax=Salinibacter grassmerensis TaxID=3040353 RepID=UPI0021E7FFBB|nr:ABC transporter ATP-binding protein [Salinibacter grassmerensis]
MATPDRDDRESTLAILSRLWGVLSPYKARVIGVALLISFSAALEAAGPQFVRYAFDVVIPGGRSTLFLWFGLAFAGFYLFRAIVEYGGMYWSFALTQQVVSDVRMQAYDHLLTLPVSRFSSEQSGSLSSRVVSDPNALKGMIQAAASRLSGQLVAILVVAGLLVWMNWKLALVNLVVLPILAFVTYYYQEPLRTASRSIRETVARLTATSTEAISNIRVVKAFVGEGQERERFGKHNQRYVDINLDRRKDVGKMEGLINITSNYGTGALLLVGGWMVVTGSLSLGELTAFIMYQRQLQGPVQSVMFFNDKLQAGMAALERLSELVDTDPETGGDREEVPVGPVELEEVRFSYPDAEEPALRDLSLRIEPGETAALVGSSGAGKSTVANLIGRFWDPQEGRVTVDGIDLRSFDLQTLREQVALVPQDPTLFSGTVADNIRYAEPDASDEAVRRAAQMANAHGFIEQLVEGYDTQIGERGVRLSGGQKQRVAIARAILTDARILLLDEATSDLDSESEAVIQDALDGLFARGDRLTSIVIAHRLSTIENADTIYVMEDGGLVEQGPHDELLAEGGRYAELWALQRRDADRPAQPNVVEPPAMTSSPVDEPSSTRS